MFRISLIVTILLTPSLVTACPWVRQCCRPAPIVVCPPCPPPAVMQSASPEPPMAPIVLDADGQKWTTIKGRVVWDREKYGAPPQRKPIVATKDAGVAKTDIDFYTEDWVVHQANMGIKNVVVWLMPDVRGELEKAAFQKAVADNKRFNFKSFTYDETHPILQNLSSPNVVLDIPALRFSPHILTARTGQYVLMTNRIPVPENVKWVSRYNGEINPLIPVGGTFTVPVPLKAENFPIEIASNIHPWMRAYLRVFDHPYFAVTDADGNFVIKHVPQFAGKLRIFIWQENGMHRGPKGRFGEVIELKPGLTDLKEIRFDTVTPLRK